MAKRQLTVPQWDNALTRYEQGEPVADIARDFAIQPRTIPAKFRERTRKELHSDSAQMICRHQAELSELEGKIQIGAAKLGAADSNEEITEARDYLAALKNLTETIAIRQAAERNTARMDKPARHLAMQEVRHG